MKSNTRFLHKLNMLSASEYFASYEEEFLSIIRYIEYLVMKYESLDDNRYNKYLTPEEIRDLESKFQNAKQCIDQLKEEVAILSKKSSEYQSYQRYQRVYLELYNKFINLKEESISYLSEKDPEVINFNYKSTKNSEYFKPISKEYIGTSVEDLIKHNKDNIEISSQLAQETQQIGLYSLNTLTVQRDNLTRSKYGLNDIDYNIMESRKLASTIYKQKIIERLTLHFIIFVLIIANIYVFLKRLTFK